MGGVMGVYADRSITVVVEAVCPQIRTVGVQQVDPVVRVLLVWESDPSHLSPGKVAGGREIAWPTDTSSTPRLAVDVRSAGCPPVSEYHRVVRPGASNCNPVAAQMSSGTVATMPMTACRSKSRAKRLSPSERVRRCVAFGLPSTR